MRICFDHQLCLLFSNIYGNLTVKQGTTLCTVKLFIQLMYNKNDHLAKWSIFVRYLMSSFAYTTPSPPPLDPRRPLHMLYICIGTFNYPKGVLGLGGGGASKNKLKDGSFIFLITDVTILSIVHTHAQKEYRKVLEIKGSYLLNILALLLFKNLQRIYQNSRLNGTIS